MRIAVMYNLLFGGKKSYSIDFSSLADGPLPSVFYGPAWSVSSGKAVGNPTIGPTELFTNNDFSAWTGDNPDGWTVTGESGSNPMATEVGTGEDHTGAGTGSCNLYTTSSLISVAQNVFTVGKFYLLNPIVSYVGAGSVSFGGTNVFAANSVGNHVASIAASGASFGIARASTPTNVTIDSHSAKLIDTAEQFATVDIGLADASISVGYTVSGYHSGGVVACLDSTTNPQNYLIAYSSSVLGSAHRVFLSKCVGGVTTNLISSVVAYAAGAPIKIIKSGSSVMLYYNGTQADTTKTVSDAGIINNTRHGMFSSYSGNTLNNFSIT